MIKKGIGWLYPGADEDGIALSIEKRKFIKFAKDHQIYLLSCYLYPEKKFHSLKSAQRFLKNNYSDNSNWKLAKGYYIFELYSGNKYIYYFLNSQGKILYYFQNFKKDN